jgi:hypothetical protein
MTQKRFSYLERPILPREEAVRHLAYIREAGLTGRKWTYSDQNH